MLFVLYLFCWESLGLLKINDFPFEMFHSTHTYICLHIYMKYTYICSKMHAYVYVHMYFSSVVGFTMSEIPNRKKRPIDGRKVGILKERQKNPRKYMEILEKKLSYHQERKPSIL